MEDQNQTSFTFVLDNFSSEKKISSPKFSSGGWEWFVNVYPKDEDDHYFSMYLVVANPESLRPGLRRRVSFFFVLLNQSGKEIYRTSECCKLFCTELSELGCSHLPLEAIRETNKLFLKVELVKVGEVVDFNGFQAEVDSVHSLRYGNLTLTIRVTNQLLKKPYTNLLLGIMATLNKPTHSLTKTELSNARNNLVELTEAGFNVNWFKTMLDEVYMERFAVNIADFPLYGSPLVREDIKNQVKAARDWLQGVVHSWKATLGFTHHLRNYEKID